MIQVLIIGGGLAGLMNAIILSRSGIEVLLLEKRSYPFHRVCGEYVSNEVLGFLRSIGAYPEHLEPSKIDRLMISNTGGLSEEIELGLGGFGISRFAFDDFLYQRATEAGAQIRLNTQVVGIESGPESTIIETDKGEKLEAELVVAAHGKRSRIDYMLGRGFIQQRAPFIAVKYHLRTDLPSDLIALHNFTGGYCGVNKVEGNTYNLCYLSSRENLRKFKSVEAMEEQILFQNPYLKDLFMNSDFLFDKPEVINEVSFASKAPVDNDIFMTGDSAGLITPLCGNGMAMAIHSSKILSELMIENSRELVAKKGIIARRYKQEWSRNFASRLWVGRKSQHLFGGPVSSGIGVGILRYVKPLARVIISKTHGKPF